MDPVIMGGLRAVTQRSSRPLHSMLGLRPFASAHDHPAIEFP